MLFYKILRQKNIKKTPIQLTLDSKNYIEGLNSFSFAVKYSPDSYYSLINSRLYDTFIEYSVSQLIVTNQKFLYLYQKLHYFELEMIDIKFENNDFNDFYPENEVSELTFEELGNLIEEYNLKIKEGIYINKRNKNRITLQNNGVIGIDKELINTQSVKLLIDTLNFGLRVLKYE